MISTTDVVVPVTRSVVEISGGCIDYVFVGNASLRAGSAGRILAAELAFDDTLTGRVASDHTGLVVDVLWPQRPPA